MKIGEIGENLACEFLIERGYRILARNYRKPWGEIDIVAKAVDDTLVFVEVKTLVSKDTEDALAPEDNMSKAKTKKLRTVCETFVAYNENLCNEQKGWRIDLVAIVAPPVPDKLKIGDKNMIIKHYENI